MKFWRKSKSVHDRDLGLLTCHRKPFVHWASENIPTPAGDVLINVPGSEVAPSASALALAKKLLAQPQAVVASAISYVRGNPTAQEFIEGEGDLTLDGFSFTDVPGAFHVSLALSKWPDAMINVEFLEGIPCGVSLAD